jgi:hypothetical protein
MIMFALILTLVVSFNVFALNNPSFVSDTSVMVYGPRTVYPENAADWGDSKPAMETWKHPSWPMIPGSDAKWISTSYYIGDDGGPVAEETWRKFTKTIDMCRGAYNISGTITSNADNAEAVYVNEVWLYSDGAVQGAPEDNWEWSTVVSSTFTTAPANSLVIDFIVRNFPGNALPTSNPTGLIFTASVDNDCPIMVDIDIKPGSFPSCFRNDGNGVIPVAIFGSTDFDVYAIDPGTVQLEGLRVITKAKSNKLMAAYEDFNRDGFMDLVLKFQDVEGTFMPGMGTATLTGTLFDGTHIMGDGDICIRK